jgi:hypothetical protein
VKSKGQPGHRTTTAHIQAAYPFVAEGGLGGRGAYIGRDIYGGSFCYDPWELYGRELTSPNAVVLGIVGRAKSSLVKSYVFRQAVFGRQLGPAQPADAPRRTRPAAQPALLRRRRRARTAALARREESRAGGAACARTPR